MTIIVRAASTFTRVREPLTPWSYRSARKTRALPTPAPLGPRVAAEYLMWLGAGLAALPMIAVVGLAEGVRAIAARWRGRFSITL